ncbi:MAG: MXAN_2562 family outer membrane beta-barrel protein [Myxococcota bacterium]
MRAFTMIDCVALATLLALTSVPTHAAMTSSTAPPSWGMELRMGPFRPRISDNARDRDYYALIYADHNKRSVFKNRPLLKTVETSRYLLTGFGLLGATVSVGHWVATAPTRVCQDPNDANVTVGCTPASVWQSTPGNDTTALTVVPIGVGVVYRFDFASRRLSVPLVPYAKAGLDYALWWNTAGGRLSKSAVTKGSGGTLGYTGALGLMLNLDWIEPNTASRARATSGIADSYVYVDWTLRVSDGFSDPKRLGTSGRVLAVGLALDML